MPKTYKDTSNANHCKIIYVICNENVTYLMNMNGTILRKHSDKKKSKSHRCEKNGQKVKYL